jgi:hypothetical protein
VKSVLNFVAIALAVVFLGVTGVETGTHTAVGAFDASPRVPAPGVRVTIEEYDGPSAMALELIGEDDSYLYYLSSMRSAGIMLTFEDGQRLSLRDALSQNKIGMEDLIENGLQAIKEPRQEER